MFDISLRWQNGAVQLGIYVAAIVAILWVMSKIELPDRGETPTDKERVR